MPNPSKGYTILADLAQEVTPPADGILSRTLLNDDSLKVVAFGFAAGEELSEQTAATAAVLHVLHGEATLTLGTEQRHQASAGTCGRKLMSAIFGA